MADSKVVLRTSKSVPWRPAAANAHHPHFVTSPLTVRIERRRRCQGSPRDLCRTTALGLNFLPKFDNRSDAQVRLSSLRAGGTDTGGAAPCGSRCLMVSKKHSGHLVMCPPFFAKNRAWADRPAGETRQSPHLPLDCPHLHQDSAANPSSLTMGPLSIRTALEGHRQPVFPDWGADPPRVLRVCVARYGPQGAAIGGAVRDLWCLRGLAPPSPAHTFRRHCTVQHAI